MGIQKSSRKITWRSGSLKWALIDGYGLNLQGFPFSKISVSRHWRQVKWFMYLVLCLLLIFFSVNILVALYHKILNGELAMHTRTCTNTHKSGGYRHLQHSNLFLCTPFQAISRHPQNMTPITQNGFTYSLPSQTRNHVISTFLYLASFLHSMPRRYIYIIAHSTRLFNLITLQCPSDE